MSRRHQHSAWPTSPLLLVVVELWSISQLLHLFHQSAGGICVWLYDACYLVFVYLPGSSMVLMSKSILYMFRVALIPRGCLRDGGKRNKQCGRGGMLHSQSPGHGTLRGRCWGWGDSVFNFDIDTDEKLLLWLLCFACKSCLFEISIVYQLSPSVKLYIQWWIFKDVCQFWKRQLVSTLC